MAVTQNSTTLLEDYQACKDAINNLYTTVGLSAKTWQHSPTTSDLTEYAATINELWAAYDIGHNEVSAGYANFCSTNNPANNAGLCSTVHASQYLNNCPSRCTDQRNGFQAQCTSYCPSMPGGQWGGQYSKYSPGSWP